MNVHRSQQTRGQIVVLFVLAVVAMIAMVGLIVDGGNAYTNQRATQNATDSAADAGATVLLQSLLSVASGNTPKSDADVFAAMGTAATDNNIKPFGPDDADHSSGYYTDVRGNMLTAAGGTTTTTLNAVRVGVGPIPPCIDPGNCVNGVASGVRASGRRTFSTFVSSAIGLGSFTAQSGATAVAGYVAPCTAEEGCAVLPITFATNQTACDTSGDESYTDVVWEPVDPDDGYTLANEALLSLCKKGEGAFGWLDFGGGNTASQILNPTNQQFYPPLWQLGQPGNPNNVEDELATYFGNSPGVYEGPDDPDGDYDQTVLIPFFNALCNEDRPDSPTPSNPTSVYEPPVFPGPNGPFPGECQDNPSGGGANRYYSIPYFIGFIFDRAYVQGGNFDDCNDPPGTAPNEPGPLPGGNGSGGCLMGWISFTSSSGPVGASPPGGNIASPMGVQLIK